ncbi:hypothetical protein E2C01_007528 [Portunus trituberculatus]|uniref:Uncharacterized protein n=1 Tax=Portunus trituberculatus TaxID=210409 RepID=A0A5B7D0D3_PORTR|nr:hypothetical protein [Portunus trituberculatus]
MAARQVTVAAVMTLAVVAAAGMALAMEDASPRLGERNLTTVVEENLDELVDVVEEELGLEDGDLSTLIDSSTSSFGNIVYRHVLTLVFISHSIWPVFRNSLLSHHYFAWAPVDDSYVRILLLFHPFLHVVDSLFRVPASSTVGFVLGGLMLFVSIFDTTRTPVIMFFENIFGGRQTRRRREVSAGLDAQVAAAFHAFTSAVDKMDVILRMK